MGDSVPPHCKPTVGPQRRPTTGGGPSSSSGPCCAADPPGLSPPVLFTPHPSSRPFCRGVHLTSHSVPHTPRRFPHLVGLPLPLSRRSIMIWHGKGWRLGAFASPHHRATLLSSLAPRPVHHTSHHRTPHRLAASPPRRLVVLTRHTDQASTRLAVARGAALLLAARRSTDGCSTDGCSGRAGHGRRPKVLHDVEQLLLLAVVRCRASAGAAE